MTEEEWLACGNPTPMLEYLRGKASDRKLRLFAAAGGRRVCALLLDSRSLAALQAAEAEAGPAEMAAARVGALEAVSAAERDNDSAEHGLRLAEDFGPEPKTRARLAASEALARLVGTDAFRAAVETAGAAVQAAEFGNMSTHLDYPFPASAELRGQADLLRDIFPYHPVTLSPSWLTTTVVALAKGIYDDRAFDRMPILADALLDAGCSDDRMLRHCREAVHARGCWVVDACLGKS